MDKIVFFDNCRLHTLPTMDKGAIGILIYKLNGIQEKVFSRLVGDERYQKYRSCGHHPYKVQILWVIRPLKDVLEGSESKILMKE